MKNLLAALAVIPLLAAPAAAVTVMPKVKAPAPAECQAQAPSNCAFVIQVGRRTP
jgi:hypothetical protein